MKLEPREAIRFWKEKAGVDHAINEDLFEGMASLFVDDLHWESPESVSLLENQPVIYLANHQVAIESLLFSFLVSARFGNPVTAIAKAEHESSWVSALFRQVGIGSSEGSNEMILFFDRDQQSSFLDLMQEAAVRLTQGRCSLLIHVEGTRSLACRQPVSKLTSVLVDLALRARVPIVPVRFWGGLPVEPAASRLEFPLGLGAQTYGFGSPLFPDQLDPMPFAERTRFVLEQINSVGPPIEEELPSPPNLDLQERVGRWKERCGDSFVSSCLGVLESVENPREDTSVLLDVVDRLSRAGAFPSGVGQLAGFLDWLVCSDG